MSEPKTQKTVGLVAECEADPNYVRHFNPDDAAAAGEGNCDLCGSSAGYYRGFKGYGGYRAIYICASCSHETDF